MNWSSLILGIALVELFVCFAHDRNENSYSDSYNTIMEVKVVLASEHTRRMRLRVLPPSYQSAIYYLRNRSTISSFVKYDVQAAFAIDSLNAAASNVTRLAASSSCSTEMFGTTDRGRRAGRAPYKTAAKRTVCPNATTARGPRAPQNGGNGSR